MFCLLKKRSSNYEIKKGAFLFIKAGWRNILPRGRSQNRAELLTDLFFCVSIYSIRCTFFFIYGVPVHPPTISTLFDPLFPLYHKTCFRCSRSQKPKKKNKSETCILNSAYSCLYSRLTRTHIKKLCSSNYITLKDKVTQLRSGSAKAFLFLFFLPIFYFKNNVSRTCHCTL